MSAEEQEKGELRSLGVPVQGTDVFVASGVQPDETRTWYEVPESVVDELRRTIDPDETFVECLLRLLLQREGTYQQVLAENRRLKSEKAS